VGTVYELTIAKPRDWDRWARIDEAYYKVQPLPPPRPVRRWGHERDGDAAKVDSDSLPGMELARRFAEIQRRKAAVGREEQELLGEVLQFTRGRISAAHRLLGISRDAFRFRCGMKAPGRKLARD
jgi:DNA-binding NtrC family response regulator